ncbi:MAG: EAL domain-containing protein [Pseudomonadota bacterium]
MDSASTSSDDRSVLPGDVRSPARVTAALILCNMVTLVAAMGGYGLLAAGSALVSAAILVLPFIVRNLPRRSASAAEEALPEACYMPWFDTEAGALTTLEITAPSAALPHALDRTATDAPAWRAIDVAVHVDGGLRDRALIDRLCNLQHDLNGARLICILPAPSFRRHARTIERLRGCGLIVAVRTGPKTGRGIGRILQRRAADLIVAEGIDAASAVMPAAADSNTPVAVTGLSRSGDQRTAIAGGMLSVAGPSIHGAITADVAMAMQPSAMALARTNASHETDTATDGASAHLTADEDTGRPHIPTSRVLPAAEWRLMEDLRAAYGTGDLAMHYQPKMHCRTNRIDGAEGLIRWAHPAKGALSPTEFIRIAERSGDIVSLTHWTLDRAVEDQQRLKDEGLDLDISVNLSAGLVCNRAFLSEAVRRLEPRAGRIALEITETAIIDDPDAALAGLEMLTEAGIALSIDDYGAGMSSLTYLKRVPACELKIDRLFSAELARSHNDPMLMRSSIDLAHGLGMEVTAEGIETQASLALLRVMGCDRVQGFLTGRPMPIDRFIAFIRDHEHLNAVETPSTGFSRAANFW